MSATASALRRGACPALTTPMQTGDGLLVRLAASGMTIGLDQAAGLCAAAGRCGNGIIEVTARGGIQIRGLSATSATDFAAAIAALGIDAGASVPILLDPLAGLAPEPAFNVSGIADDLRQQLAAATFMPRLGPKVSIALDGGGKLHLDAITSDIRLRADGPRWHVSVGGDATTAMPLGSVAPHNAAEAALRLLQVIAQHGPQARARELSQHCGWATFKSAIADLLDQTPCPPARPRSDSIGTHPLRDGRIALGIGLAFGHTNAEVLSELIAVAERAGAAGLRTAPDRTLLIVALAPQTAGLLAGRAEGLGFITRADDPRRSVVACAGAPICGAAEIPARALAPSICNAAAPLLDGSLTIHLSGCLKGCAHPGACALTIVGSERGCDLVIGGTARGVPSGTVANEKLAASLERLASEIARSKQSGETAAAALARLPVSYVADLFGALPRA